MRVWSRPVVQEKPGWTVSVRSLTAAWASSPLPYLSRNDPACLTSRGQCRVENEHLWGISQESEFGWLLFEVPLVFILEKETTGTRGSRMWDTMLAPL